MINFPTRNILAARQPIAASDAARIAVTHDRSLRPDTLPDDLITRGQIAYVTTRRRWTPCPRLEAMAQRHELDLVVARITAVNEAAASVVFRLGVRLHWKILWHDDFRLWLGEGGEDVCFISLDPTIASHFWIEDGRLACDNSLPFQTMADRDRGLLAAARMLRSLVRAR